MQFAAAGLSQKSHNHFPKAWWILSLDKMDIEIMIDEYIKHRDKINLYTNNRIKTELSQIWDSIL
jgi:hypothetical protein